MTVTIRPATAADVAAIAQIEKQCFSDPWSEESFRSLVEGAHALFLVAISPDGRVVGYTASIDVREDAELLNVAVNLDWRRQGIGALLLDSIIAALLEKQVKTLYLEVRESNVAALALYKSREFRELSLRRNYYRRPVENALVLSLDLAPG